jgi:hypothetical protein
MIHFIIACILVGIFWRMFFSPVGVILVIGVASVLALNAYLGN